MSDKLGGMIKKDFVGRRMVLVGMLAACVCVVVPIGVAQQENPAALAVAPPGVLRAADLTSLFPQQVFFRGQSATVQMRNSGGIRYGDGMLTMAALVDTSGYSSGIQQRYQAYLITEVPLRIDGASGRKLLPGAYGVGFIQDNRFIVMDLGAHELMNVASERDAGLHRATPLQVMQAPQSGSYRLYVGRAFVTLQRAE
jgi:hypothetical protein